MLLGIFLWGCIKKCVFVKQVYTLKGSWHRNPVTVIAVDTRIADQGVDLVYIFTWHLFHCELRPFWVVLIHNNYCTTLPSFDCEFLLFILKPMDCCIWLLYLSNLMFCAIAFVFTIHIFTALYPTFNIVVLNHEFPSWTIWIICTAPHLPSISYGSFSHAWESFQVFVTELCEVLVHFKANCEDVDLRDRAHMYHSLLVSLSNKKVSSYTHTHTHTHVRMLLFTSYCPMSLCIRRIDTVIVFIFMYGLYNDTLSIAAYIAFTGINWKRFWPLSFYMFNYLTARYMYGLRSVFHFHACYQFGDWTKNILTF